MKYACCLQELERVFVAKYGDVGKIEKGGDNLFAASLLKSTTSITRSKRTITSTTEK